MLCTKACLWAMYTLFSKVFKTLSCQKSAHSNVYRLSVGFSYQHLFPAGWLDPWGVLKNSSGSGSMGNFAHTLLTRRTCLCKVIISKTSFGPQSLLVGGTLPVGTIIWNWKLSILLCIAFTSHFCSFFVLHFAFIALFFSLCFHFFMYFVLFCFILFCHYYLYYIIIFFIFPRVQV